MIAAFAAVWMKLNLLLLLAFVLWQGSKWLAELCGQSLRFNAELRLARWLFVATLLAPVVLLTTERMFGLGPQISGLTVFAETLSAGIDGGLAKTVSVSSAEFSAALLFVAALASGLLIQAVQLTRRYRQLGRLLAASTPFRKLHGVHIVFSTAVATPFSTRALGTNHIVLPYQLLQSPTNLGLALKHELQHVRNGDLCWVLFIEFLKPLFFWNPAWYLWLNEFHCLQEYACDEALLRKPSVHAHEYGNCLLEVASHATTAPVWAASNMVPQFASFRSAHSQLKRRVLMLELMRNDSFKIARVSGYAAVLALGVGLSTAGLMAQQQEVEKPSYLPLTTAQPRYPADAIAERLTGWTHLTFDVDSDGSVSNVAVIDKCVRPENYDASTENGCVENAHEAADIFDAASIAALEQFTFEPRVVNDAAVATPGVQYVFRFSLQEGEGDLPTRGAPAPVR